MGRFSRDLFILLRAERLIARRSMAVLRRQTLMIVAAGAAAGLAVVMLNVAAYLALTEVVSPPLAALIVAGANIALTIGLALWAGSINADREVESAVEVRDMAMSDLEAEVTNVVNEISGLTDGLRGIGRDPIGALVPALIMPVLTLLLRSLTRKDADQPDKKD